MRIIKTSGISFCLMLMLCLSGCVKIDEEKIFAVYTEDAVVTTDGVILKGRINKNYLDKVVYSGIRFEIYTHDYSCYRDELYCDSLQGEEGNIIKVSLPFVYDYDDKKIILQHGYINYQAFVVDEDGEVGKGFVRQIRVDTIPVDTIPVDTINVHGYVDLGLPSGLKWATMNVGASKPEEYGNYYAWGETEPKMIYSWSTYEWCNGSEDTLTKYCTKSSYGTIDNKIVLELADDAARANWGGAWRMPTGAEWTELLENCTWTWTTDYNGTGVAGRIVTSNINGNSIFLPAAGYRIYDGRLYDAGSYATYWSSSLYNTGTPDLACCVRFDSGYLLDRSCNDRYRGTSVRPVCE